MSEQKTDAAAIDVVDAGRNKDEPNDVPAQAMRMRPCDAR